MKQSQFAVLSDQEQAPVTAEEQYFVIANFKKNNRVCSTSLMYFFHRLIAIHTS